MTGGGQVTQRESRSGSGWLGNDTALSYDADGDGTTGSFGNLDFSGRVVNQKVTDDAGTTTRTDINYQANRDSSPKYAEPQSATVLGRSSLYTYDGLHRLGQADMGRLNSGKTAVTDEWSTPQSLVYSMDILGNMSTLNRKNSGTDANETRTHNATNELTSRSVAGEAARHWANDPFTDNDTVQWAVADLNTGGSDGTWAAASGKLSCSAVAGALSGHSGVPDSATGSVFLFDGPRYQQTHITAVVKLSAGCDNAGIVFGYIDRLNFWVRVWSKASQTIRLYEVSNGTWTQRASAVTITSGNRHDKKLVARTFNSLMAQRPARMKHNMCLDKGYDYPDVRQLVEKWGYSAHIPIRGVPTQTRQRMPAYRARRWVVERTHSWLNRFRRLLIRWEKKVHNYAAMLHLACAFITLRAAGVMG